MRGIVERTPKELARNNRIKEKKEREREKKKKKKRTPI
jgi:hypothetical protein